jgi:hypothetical protein
MTDQADMFANVGGTLVAADFSRARFNGEVYDPANDDDRLRKQIGRVWDAMRDGKWLTLGEIEAITGDPQASISAQLRHLRKPRFGSHQIEKRHRGEESAGLWEYRLIP